MERTARRSRKTKAKLASLPTRNGAKVLEGSYRDEMEREELKDFEGACGQGLYAICS